jgi:hypothetical protein
MNCFYNANGDYVCCNIIEKFTDETVETGDCEENYKFFKLSNTCQMCPRNYILENEKCIPDNSVTLATEVAYKYIQPLRVTDKKGNKNKKIKNKNKCDGITGPDPDNPNSSIEIPYKDHDGDFCFAPCPAGKPKIKQHRQCAYCPSADYKFDPKREKCNFCSDGTKTLELINDRYRCTFKPTETIDASVKVKDDE